jgi:hypothetical protein
MNTTSRRKFIADAAKTTAAAGFVTFEGNKANHMPAKNLFVHHVYFWLKNPASKEDYAKLIKGLEGLSKIPYIKMFHIGKPADTSRDVIDTTYNVSWLLLFNNKEEEETYQRDPIHLKFVDECKHLWTKVVVYDSVDV